jgi:hypothetical protein
MTTTHTAKRSIYVEAREWFDSTGGNSYYSARVWVDGKHAFTTGMNYGYDNQNEYDVTEILVRLGHLPKSLAGRSVRWAKDLGLDVYTVKYDARKRDLWKADYPKTDAELGAEIVGRKLAQILN